MRRKASLTQESFKNSNSPRISTLMEYAKATGHELKIDFI
jgi:DNA-binding phage protein